jgi:hypothetical protein
MSHALRTTSAPQLTFVVGPVARFEANLAAVVLLKTLAAEGRPATPEERAVLARFSGFGDSTFEPAFRLTAHRSEDPGSSADTAFAPWWMTASGNLLSALV